MNKTYSVIWSEVRHAYIVVSEYARKGYAKAAMAALAAAVVVSTGMPAALAAAPPAVNAATVSGTDNVVTLRDGTTASDVNQAFELVYTHSNQIEANANNIATNKAAMEQADAALHTEILEEADARQAADEKEAATRAAADTALNGAVNGGLSLDDNGVLQKVTTSVNADGEIGWNKEAATQLVLNKGGENQITLSENGIKVGLNSTVQDANGFYAGGDTAAAAKAALNADGSIKGADGKFTVDTDGNVASGNVTSTGTVQGATLTDGIATMTNGNINTTGTITGGTVTSTGNISALGDINANGALTGASLSVTGDITGGSLTVNGATSINGTTNINGDMVATGKVQGSSITDGTATLQGGNLTNVGSIEAATVTTTGNATIGGDLKVDGEFNAGTLASRVDANNFTEISGGKVHSKNFNAGPEQLTSESTFDENGRNEYARDDESISKNVLSADEISQKIADVGDNPQAYAERAVKQGTDNKYSMADTVKDGAKTNVASQSATESSDVITDDDGNTSTFRQKVDALLQEIKNAAGTESSSVEQKLDSITSTVTDGTNTTSTEQTTTDITNKAENGTITNTAKDLVNTATENMTNTVGKDLTTTVGGNMATTVTGNQTNTITGDQTNTIGGKLTTTVTGDVTEDYKANLTTTVGGNKSETVTGTSEETVTGKKTETYNGGLETT
ncbi:MAG: ESPR-type extended signal peptide-containing protein, partial [Succiniclasticum sp.]|nr:ESPR-type extended signal peptide-containing protein [Succiniclasticum sp.]